MIRIDSNPNNRTPLTKVVFMDENLDPSFIKNIPNATSGTVLLPPPSVVRNYIDSNDLNYYTFEYQGYLSMYCRDFIAAMLYDAVFFNTDILIVIDSNHDMYMNQILMFMDNMYGFNINTQTLAPDPNRIMTLRNDLVMLCGVSEYEVTSKLYPNAISPFIRRR